MPNNSKIPSVYVSYAWNAQSEKIVDALERKFSDGSVNFIRDKKNLGYKGRIKEFMEEIGLGKYVIVVISNKYLRSENCMFELLQIFKNNNFYERIFPLVLDEVKIAKASDRVELVKYWENETKNLDNKIRELTELSNIQGVADDLNLYSEIRNNIARLTNILKDINTLNVDKHISSDFQQLYTSLESKIKAERSDNNGNGTNKKLLSRILYAVLAIAVLFIGYSYFNSNGNTGDKKRDDAKTPPESKYYAVKLNVNSRMADGKVFVDQKPATVLGRGNAHIIVQLLKKEGPYRFEVKNNAGSCLAEEAINKDSTELEMPCKRNEVAVQYYRVKLLVNTNMTDGKVLVDGQPARIVERGATYITVRVKKSSNSYQFEVKNEIGFCEAQKTIEKDADEILMRC